MWYVMSEVYSLGSNFVIFLIAFGILVLMAAFELSFNPA